MPRQSQPFIDWIKPPLRDAWFLTGPTASGKSRVALDLAGKIDAEIISVDSMAVYREMDIGTAKPTSDQRERVPHHLIDLVDPTGEYSVSQFVVDAHAKADEIRARGKKVLLVGGTPLSPLALRVALSRTGEGGGGGAGADRGGWGCGFAWARTNHEGSQ